MCGNTRPKLWEVGYGKMSQHNKGLLTISSPVPHSTEYRTHLERARHGGFQTLDAEHRTDSRRPLDQPPGTTTETDEDGDRWRRRQANTETDEDGDGRRQTQSGDERSGSSLTADDTPDWRRRNLILFSCNPLTPEPMKDAAVSAAPGPVVEPPQSSRCWTCFQENVGYEALSVPSGYANWSGRRLITKLSALQPKLNDVLSSSFLSPLCPKHTFSPDP